MMLPIRAACAMASARLIASNFSMSESTEPLMP
jgi:hypothetical protein